MGVIKDFRLDVRMERHKISILAILSLFIPSSTQLSCSECFHNNGLEWCTNTQELNTTINSRCLMDNNQVEEWKRWCGEEFVYHPPNSLVVEENNPYTDPEYINNQEEIIQIRPQVVEIKLSPGKSLSLDLRFKFVRGYFLELYYLMDMSKSMEQDKETIIRLADNLATELQKLTPNLKLGFGSFLDKVMLPYVNTHESWLENPCAGDEENTCREPYGYQNLLSLTNNTQQFIESVGKAKLSTNWDDPEGGLDGLIQTMVCDDIGWHRATTRHLIVYVSGSAFKYAGDGKLAGLTKQNDLECHLDKKGNYVYSSIQDYPSVAQVEKISKEKRMHVIFAVKENVVPLYRALSDLIAQSEASELKQDSSNIIDIITSIYEDISRTLILTDDSYKSPSVTLTYSSKCGENEDWVEGSKQCEDVDVNEEIQFKVHFKISKCMKKGEYATVKISPQGLEDEMKIRITSNCDCECENDLNVVEDSEKCSSNGNFACGVCMCKEGFSGEHCECEDLSESSDTAEGDECERPGDQTGRDCSGHGVCKCGVCECQIGVDGNENWMYQGTFCDCSNFDCPKSSGFLCSNHGRCECSKCICNEGWTGESCNCDTRQSNCVNPVSNKICSGRGKCGCNECECDSLEKDKSKKYFGKFCEDCESCEGRCGLYNDCIQCKVYDTGEFVDTCDQHCSFLNIIKIDKIEVKENEKRCSYKDENGCLVLSAYNLSTENLVYLQEEPNCSGKVNYYVVIGSTVALILLIGVIILIIWKCWVTIKDKREYNKFLKEYEQANYMQQMNPLYKDPVTRVTNPLREMNN